MKYYIVYRQQDVRVSASKFIRWPVLVEAYGILIIFQVLVASLEDTCIR